MPRRAPVQVRPSRQGVDVAIRAQGADVYSPVDGSVVGISVAVQEGCLAVWAGARVGSRFALFRFDLSWIAGAPRDSMFPAHRVREHEFQSRILDALGVDMERVAGSGEEVEGDATDRGFAWPALHRGDRSPRVVPSPRRTVHLRVVANGIEDRSLQLRPGRCRLRRRLRPWRRGRCHRRNERVRREGNDRGGGRNHRLTGGASRRRRAAASQQPDAQEQQQGISGRPWTSPIPTQPRRPGASASAAAVSPLERIVGPCCYNASRSEPTRADLGQQPTSQIP